MIRHATPVAFLLLLLSGCDHASISVERPYPITLKVYYVRPLCGHKVDAFDAHDGTRWIVIPTNPRVLVVEIRSADLEVLRRYCATPEPSRPEERI